MTRVVIMANNIDEVGGAQRVAHVLAQGLAERGHAVDLVGVTPYSPRHAFIAAPAYREFRLMPSAWPPPPPDNRPRTRIKPSVRRLLRTRADLRAQAIDALGAVLADGPPGVVVTTQLWAMEHLVEVPHGDWAVIGQYHSSYEAAAAGRDLPRILSLYRDVDVVTMLSPGDADAVRRDGLDNVTWLPNPLAFWPATPAPADARTVTYLGRLSPEKGVPFLLDAWGRIAAEHPDWRLRLVGSGPDEHAVRTQATGLPEGGDRVDILPPVADAEAELRGAGVVVQPSLTEGLPLALAEAMALGLPCIASDCSSGVRLLTEDGRAARLVARADAAALARAMSALMDSADERRELGAAARVAMEPYRADRILDRWERLLVDVLR